MSNTKRLILILLLIVVAAVLLGLPPRQSSPARTQMAAHAFGGGAGLVSHSSILPQDSAKRTGPPSDSKPTSHRAMIAGGAGAGPAAGSGVGPSTPGVPQEVLEAAKTGLPFFLGQIPPGSKELYGFASTDDLSAARLGGPLQMLTI